jgi:hypothetical protein
MMFVVDSLLRKGGFVMMNGELRKLMGRHACAARASYSRLQYPRIPEYVGTRRPQDIRSDRSPRTAASHYTVRTWYCSSRSHH